MLVEIYLKNYIFSLFSLYIFSLLIFVVKNTDFFKTNSDVHSFNKRSHHDLHISAANLAVFQKGVWHSGIKIYNHLPQTLKQLAYDISKFKVALKRFLFTNSFYTLEEYYSLKLGSWFFFIHSFNMHSVNPCKVNQPIGYRVCHNANVIYI